MQGELKTERLLWRLPRGSDVESYLALVSDFEVVKNLASWPYPADRVFTASRCVPVDPARGFAGLVFLDNQVIGGVGLIEGEFGYMFARAHWGFGYATEMGRAMLARGLCQLHWTEVMASTWMDNPASARVLEKLGFGEVGTSIHPCKAQRRDVAARDFVLTRADWQARYGQ